MLKFLFCFFGLFGLSIISFAQHEAMGRKWVDTLSSPYFFGRGYVKDGVNKAADFIGSEFERMGLEHLPGQQSYFQEFTLDVNTFPGKIGLKQGKRELINGVHYMVNPNSGPGNGKKLKFTKLDSLDLDNTEQLKVKMQEIQSGKTDGALFDLANMSKANEMRLKHELLGLGNFFPILFISSNKMDWAVGRTQLKYPVLTIADSVYKADQKYSICVEAEFVNDFKSKNVMAYIPSEDESAKTYVFTAHYDHLGGMGDEVYIPGAHDNASGTSMLAVLADHYIENPSQHNLIFIAFAGEEAGLIGSSYFVESNIMDVDSIHFLLNLDLMGSGEEGITLVNGSIFKEAFDIFHKINDEKKYLKLIKSRGETQNSDHHHFYQKGVPSFFIYSQGAFSHYHDIYDSYDRLPFSAYDDIVNLLIDFIEQY
jgi:hypothetical protein